MQVNFKLISAFLITSLLAGCSATQIAYEPSASISSNEAATLLVDLTLSQKHSRVKPSIIEVRETSILWNKDKMFFVTMQSVELLSKRDKYLVQVNFEGDVFRKNDWFIVYKSENIDDAKRYIDVFVSLIKSRNSQFKNIIEVETSKAAEAPTPK